MSSSDFEVFLADLENQWEVKQQKIESKFLDLRALSDQLTTILEKPPQKKRKRSSRSVQPSRQEDPFASYAAELQVEFFKKVQKLNLLKFEIFVV